MVFWGLGVCRKEEGGARMSLFEFHMQYFYIYIYIHNIICTNFTCNTYTYIYNIICTYINIIHTRTHTHTHTRTHTHTGQDLARLAQRNHRRSDRASARRGACRLQGHRYRTTPAHLAAAPVSGGDTLGGGGVYFEQNEHGAVGNCSSLRKCPARCGQGQDGACAQAHA